MLVADTYLGHRDDSSVAAELESSDYTTVVLSDTERRRSRVRTETTTGRDIGIVIARDLGDGDVIKTEAGSLVVVELAAVEALVLDFEDSEVAPTTALKFGHEVGNKHWTLAISGEQVILPLTGSKKRMEATVADLLPADVPTRYEHVPPTTFDDGETNHTHSGSDHSHDGTSHSHDSSVHTIDGGSQ